MSIGANVEAVRRFYDRCMNEGDITAVAGVIHPTFVDRSYGMQGIAEVEQFVGRSRADWPDLRFTIEEIIAQDDRVAVRWTGRGSHRTGTKATWTGMGFYRLVDGMIAEHWANSDQLGLLRQLGAIPTPGQQPPADH